ncbi:MAG: hypothetical protein REI11_20970 [Patulibacter sp.]|nr:hypothetical protein [Patulibacter sp.]
MAQNLPGTFRQRQELDKIIRQLSKPKLQAADQAAINAAMNQATSASTAAANAQNSANNAQTSANTAQTTANGAQADATTALARSARFRLQVGTVNAIAVGASVDVPIVWSTPFPNANYDTDITAFTGLIGRATLVVKSGSKTAAGCTVTVTATLLVSLGSQFFIGAVLSS